MTAQNQIPYSDPVLETARPYISETWHNFLLSIQPKAWGQATFTAGSVTVSNQLVQSSSLVIVSRGSSGSGVPYQGAIVPGVSFTINSSDGGDTGLVNWALFV